MAEEVQLPDNKGTTAGKTLQWIVTIGIGLGTLGPYVAPEKFTTEKEEGAIHENVEQMKEEVRDELMNEIDEELKKAKWQHKNFDDRISKVESNQKNIITIQDANKKHREWNTQAISIHSELFVEQLEKKKREYCPEKKYFQSNTGDDWNIFDDRYESRMVYSIDRRSGCREYYTPIDGSKTLVE